MKTPHHNVKLFISSCFGPLARRWGGKMCKKGTVQAEVGRAVQRDQTGTEETENHRSLKAMGLQR